MVLLLDVVIDVGCEVDEMLAEEVGSELRVVIMSCWEVISGLDVWVDGNSDILIVVTSSVAVMNMLWCIAMPVAVLS